MSQPTNEPNNPNPSNADGEGNKPSGNPAPQTNPAGNNKGAADPPAPQPKTYNEDEHQAAITRAVKEAEKKAKDAVAKAKMSEDERVKAEMEELRASLRERDARDAVISAAEKLVKNPSMIYRLVKDQLEFNEKGKVSNLQEILTQAKADFPELFDNKPSQSIDAGAGANNGGQAKPEDEVSEMFKKTGRTNSFRL